METGSITRGAERTNMALASASERVWGMEDVVGVPLLSRLQRRGEATPAGHSVARHARRILSQVDRMRGELQEHAAGLKGRVSRPNGSGTIRTVDPVDEARAWIKI